MRKVEVTAYNPEWERKFKKASAEIRDVLGNECIIVHHIGSTSVRGLAAKPIIDLMPIVRDIQRIDESNNKLEALGYEAKGENGIPGRRYFQRGGDNRSHHVHIFELGDPHIKSHLAFRDFLQKHPQVSEEYGKLKVELALRYPYDIEQYIAGKEALVLQIEKMALEE